MGPQDCKASGTHPGGGRLPLLVGQAGWAGGWGGEERRGTGAAHSAECNPSCMAGEKKKEKKKKTLRIRSGSTLEGEEKKDFVSGEKKRVRKCCRRGP